MDRCLLTCSDRVRSLLATQAIYSIALALLIILQMMLLSRIIHEVFMTNASVLDVRLQLILLLSLIAIRAITAGRQQWVSQRIAIAIKTDLRHTLFDRWTQAGPSTLNLDRTGELSSLYLDGLDKLEAYYARYIPRAIQVMILPTLIAVTVCTVDLLSGGILLITAPLIPIFMVLIGSMAERRTQKQWTAMSRMSAHFLDVLQGVATLKLFGRENEQAREIKRISKRYRLTTMGVLKIAFLSGLVLELAASLSTALVAVQIGVRLVEGHILFQPGLFVLLLTPEFYLPFRQLGAEHHAAMEGKAAANKLFQQLDRVIPPASSQMSPLPATVADLSLAHVTYTYPDRNHPAIKDLSMHFKRGEIAAVVGPSGAGKSTLFHLIIRQLHPNSGTIRMDDTDMADCNPHEWRKRIALVPQRPTLFHGTVLDNLQMARPGASRDEIISAARQAEADAFIVALPQGYDTPLGEQGWRLSGGERQRLALARAFVKDAPILLMDEPSAHLDPDSEERITVAFERLAQNRMVIVIAHRLRTACRANRIWVMDDGQLVESGTHIELLARQTAYARLIGGAQ